jgi:hypothetical protein
LPANLRPPRPRSPARKLELLQSLQPARLQSLQPARPTLVTRTKSDEQKERDQNRESATNAGEKTLADLECAFADPFDLDESYSKADR